MRNLPDAPACSLVLVPCPGSEDISRACCSIGGPPPPLSPHHALPMPGAAPACLPLVHSSSTHGCGLPLQTGSHLFFPPCCIEAQEAPSSTLPTPSSSLTLVGEVDTHCPPSPALAVGSCPPAPGSRCLHMGSLSTPPAQEVPHTHCSQHGMTLSECLDLEARPITAATRRAVVG